MTHPEELLAGYVDDTLSAKDRAVVDTHLAGCAKCSREVVLAAGARSALRSLPEEPAPAGVASRALEEAGGARRSTGSGGETPRWYRIGGAVAAVAAGLLVFTLVLPHIGQGDDSGSGAAKQQGSDASRNFGGAESALAATMIEIRHVNFDNASLTALTSSYGAGAAGGAANAPSQSGPAQRFGTQAQTNKALDCITKSVPPQSGELHNLIRARFQGTPAYFAVFFQGPGAGQPPDTVAVWVLATKDCGIVSSSFAQL